MNRMQHASLDIAVPAVDWLGEVAGSDQVAYYSMRFRGPLRVTVTAALVRPAHTRSRTFDLRRVVTAAEHAHLLDFVERRIYEASDGLYTRIPSPVH